MKFYTLASILSSFALIINRILTSTRKQRTKKTLKLIRCAPGDPNYNTQIFVC